MRLILKILAAPLVVALTLFVWICTILLYCTGIVLGLAALVVALLGVAVLVTYSLQNGIILLVIAFLICPWDCRLRRPGCLERSRACGMQSRTAFTGERAARIWYNRNMERRWQHGSQQQGLPGLRQENETAVHRLAAL